MYELTIKGNTIEELFGNMAVILAIKPSAPAQGFSAQQPAPAYQPPANPAPIAAPLSNGVPAAPFAPAQPPQAPAPTYTLDQLAKAGAALAQSGKMEQALALLAKYGVQTVNQLQPEQYGAFATELRTLGAQV